MSGNVQIQISRNGGTSWTTLFSSTANDGSQSWTVSGSVTTQARIRVRSVNNTSIADTSNANFSITGITVLTPNGGETWTVGSTRTIQWTSVGVSGNVQIQLSRDGGTSWTTLFSNTANDGSQNWVATGPATTQARIRVRSVSNTSIFDRSNANFAIQ